MAQASSAQREPSMEEILASIRRIIEDNDAAGRRQAAEPVAARPAQAERPVVEVDAFREELRARQPEPMDRPEPVEMGVAQREARKPSLAEIQAQIAAEAAAIPARWSEPEPESPAFVEREPDFERPLRTQRSSDDIMRAIENSRAAREDARALLGLPEPANTVTRPVERVEVEEEPAMLAEPMTESHLEAAPQDHLAEADAVSSKPTLLSERVERQVAASFSELSEAFAARSRKTFDEMAEEMIAPLLREWMENNLPTLVERIVREEIERVARGS